MSNFLKVNDKESGRDISLVHITTVAEGLITLCGYTDAMGFDADFLEQKPTCPECLAVLRYCRNIRFPTLENETRYQVPSTQQARRMAKEILHSSSDPTFETRGKLAHPAIITPNH